MRKFLILGIITLLAFAGCVKKPKKETRNFSQMPSVAQNQQPTKDSGDIFDEFYKEDAQSSGKGSSNEKTFSPHDEKPQRKSAPKATSPRNSDGKFVIQITTVKSKALAEKLVNKLAQNGVDAYVVDVDDPTPSLPGTYYRVRVGGFDNLSEARTYAEQNLVSAGYDYWIDNKANDRVGIQGNSFGSGAAPNFETTPSQSELTPTPSTTPSTTNSKTNSWGTTDSASGW